MGGIALNQLLVVMDGIDNPPFFRSVFTNRTNTLLDASFIVPRRVGGKSLRLPAPSPRKEQVYFIGATNVPIDRLDPALIRPGRMGRHVWFRTPTKHDRLDIIDLYIDKVSHEPDLDMPRRRDEIARVTNGYSPAMIEQVTSMALTIAHHSGRERFSWDDLVESITTLESGTAVGIEYVEKEGRAIAIHEAGHAIAGHAYMEDFESTRLSIKRRGDSGGHHQAREKEERFARFQSEVFAQLVWTLGAMAAERVFYDENSTGVGGDVMSATYRTALMVGGSAMGPQPFHVDPEGRRDRRRGAAARPRALRGDRAADHEPLGSGGGPMSARPDRGRALRPVQAPARRPDPRAGVRRRAQPRVTNRDAVEKIADVLMERKEIFGDELLDLLDSVGIRIPELDYGDEAIWPPPFFSLPPAAAPRAAGDRAPMSEPGQRAAARRRIGRQSPSTSSVAPREERARQSGYRRRFGVIYIVLALVAGLGLGALVVLVANPDDTPEAGVVAMGARAAATRPACARSPTTSRRGIASRTASSSSSRSAGPPTVTAGGGDQETNPIPVRAIAVRPDASTGKAEDDDIALVDASKSMQYVLCGLGDACSISQGEASEARHSLLRREALELSLYTFKYLDDVDSVTVFLPPPPGGQSPGSAVFLRRSDVKDELSRPLSQTMAPGAPSIGGIPARELQTLNRITRSKLYRYEYTQAQDLSAVLVLDPIIL